MSVNINQEFKYLSYEFHESYGRIKDNDFDLWINGLSKEQVEILNEAFEKVSEIETRKNK